MARGQQFRTTKGGLALGLPYRFGLRFVLIRGRDSGRALIPEDFGMSFEEEHVAHPRLYGAPAYARPPVRSAVTAMPSNPDDLPIAAFQTDDEREIVESLLTRPFGLPAFARDEPEPRLRPRRLSLAARAGQLLRRAS